VGHEIVAFSGNFRASSIARDANISQTLEAPMGIGGAVT
jgi:hypothetical protein